MKTTLLIFAIFGYNFSQEIAWGQIKYQNSLPYFYQSSKDSIFIRSYNEAQLPVYQEVEVEFKRDKNALVDVRFSKRFEQIFQKSHAWMEKAEKLLQKRNFSESQVYLDSIYSAYTYYPYLYSTYFIISHKLNDESLIIEYLPRFEKNATRYHKNERSQTYYELYEFYRDAKQPKKAAAFLLKSHKAIPSADKARILKTLGVSNASH